jgi:transcriptional regulator with XRE-family HTH domain
MTAGALIRAARARHGLTQTELARRARTTQTAISRLEAGGRSPSVETLERLLACMGERIELQTRPADPMSQRLARLHELCFQISQIKGAARR